MLALPLCRPSHGRADQREQRPGEASPCYHPSLSVLTGRRVHPPEVCSGRRPAQLPLGLLQGRRHGAHLPGGPGESPRCPGTGGRWLWFFQVGSLSLLLQNCLTYVCYCGILFPSPSTWETCPTLSGLKARTVYQSPGALRVRMRSIVA